MILTSSSLFLLAITNAVSAVTTSSVQLFVYGSSWSETLFNVTGTQPSASNPLGNPSFNATLSNEGGPNYARFLAEKSNTTLTLLYDLAVGGATINNDILDAGVQSYYGQVNRVFLPNYASKEGSVWNATSAIFLIWLGDNDVNRGYSSSDTDTLIDKLMQAYWNNATETLYKNGARKFFIVSTPSQERSPQVVAKGAVAVQEFKEFKWKFNEALVAKMVEFKANHSDIKTAFFNSSAFLNPILDNPTKYGFNANASCENDKAGANAGCVWQNDFHINTKAHALMARAMVPGLKTLGF